jgi:hypothetical protein
VPLWSAQLPRLDPRAPEEEAEACVEEASEEDGEEPREPFTAEGLEALTIVEAGTRRAPLIRPWASPPRVGCRPDSTA